MELLERFASGDVEVFEFLFRKFQGEVYRWIVRIVRDPGAAEDLTVETFWRIYRAREQFDPARGFGPWARRIATHVAVNHLKANRAEARRSEDAARVSVPSAIPDPALRREVSEKIEAAFGELPARLQVAARLALVEERPYEEIAEALGISRNGVKSRVFRAVRLLQRKLRKQGIVP